MMYLMFAGCMHADSNAYDSVSPLPNKAWNSVGMKQINISCSFVSWGVSYYAHHATPHNLTQLCLQKIIICMSSVLPHYDI